jgi:hypothetical protein
VVSHVHFQIYDFDDALFDDLERGDFVENPIEEKNVYMCLFPHVKKRITYSVKSLTLYSILKSIDGIEIAYILMEIPFMTPIMRS